MHEFRERPGSRWKKFRAVCLASLLGVTTVVGAEDWPQLRGSDRDGRSDESGLLIDWPASGPDELWRKPLGAGFSGMAIVATHVYTMDSNAESEHVVALDKRTGDVMWRTPIGGLFQEAAGDGPRSTPTIEDGILWALGSLGDLAALDVSDGREIWSINLPKRFGNEVPLYGFVMAPMVVGPHIVLTVGGSEQGAVVGFNKKSGQVSWTVEHEKPAYSSPIHISTNEIEQLIFLNQSNVVSLSPGGKVLWEVPFGREFPIKVASPLFVPPDIIFVSASYDIGAMAIRTRAPEILENKPIEAQVLWRNRAMRTHFNTPVQHEGKIYGFDNATLKCVDASTGETYWAMRGGLGKGSLIYVDGHLLVLTEQGRLLLVEATPKAYVEKASATILKGPTWTSPSLSDRLLFLRNSEEVVCLDLRSSQKQTEVGGVN